MQQTFENTQFGRALTEQDAATMTSLMIANVSNGDRILVSTMMFRNEPF